MLSEVSFLGPGAPHTVIKSENARKCDRYVRTRLNHNFFLASEKVSKLKWSLLCEHDISSSARELVTFLPYFEFL